MPFEYSIIASSKPEHNRKKAREQWVRGNLFAHCSLKGKQFPAEKDEVTSLPRRSVPYLGRSERGASTAPESLRGSEGSRRCGPLWSSRRKSQSPPGEPLHRP